MEGKFTDSITAIINKLKKETTELEFKEASGGLPSSLWSTVSAFANTNGGIIILGVKESNGEFTIKGITNAEKLESDFYNTLRNPKKISLFSISSNAYKIHPIGDAKSIVSIEIPQAILNEIPVYLNGDISNTYIRKGEGDYLATNEELKTLIRYASLISLDRTPIEELTLDCLDRKSLTLFKTIVSERYPSADFSNMKDEEFLMHMGMAERKDDNSIRFFNGTLLFLGKYNVIKKYYNFFHLDYFDYRGSDTRWSDRVASDDLGFEEMNLFNFFHIVNAKLIATAKTKFLLDSNLERVNTDTKDALREALVNTLVHADYAIPFGSVKIEVFDNFYRFENPGKMNIKATKFFIGGESKVKNDLLMSAFRRMGYSERQGYGGYLIYKTASNNNFRMPEIETNLEKTILTLYSTDFASSLSLISKEEKEILTYIAENNITSKKDLKEKFPTLTSYFISKTLNDLCKSELIKTKGAGRSTVYYIEKDNKDSVTTLLNKLIAELIKNKE